MDGTAFEQRFDTYREYSIAIRQTLEAAGVELYIFDPDLAHTGLESSENVALIERLLLATSESRLRIVLHDTTHLETRSPRLLRLMADFSHCFEIRQSPDDLRNLTECYLLTNNDAGVLRFHRDWPRGKWFVANPEEAGIWRSRFEQLWECSTLAVPATRLGL
jgi:hypothetical protein